MISCEVKTLLVKLMSIFTTPTEYLEIRYPLYSVSVFLILREIVQEDTVTNSGKVHCNFGRDIGFRYIESGGSSPISESHQSSYLPQVMSSYETQHGLN